jgi:hypothetical protein
MSIHKRLPLAAGLADDDREIIRHMADLYGVSEEEAEDMWRDFLELKSKADSPRGDDRATRKR